jgi:hypothetical protein
MNDDVMQCVWQFLGNQFFNFSRSVIRLIFFSVQAYEEMINTSMPRYISKYLVNTLQQLRIAKAGFQQVVVLLNIRNYSDFGQLREDVLDPGAIDSRFCTSPLEEEVHIHRIASAYSSRFIS